MVLLKNVNFESHCEHHMVPIIGVAHVAYIPNSRVVGISKLARIVEAFGKRLQIQERLSLLTKVMDENLNGIRVVRAFHSRDHELKKYDEAAAKALELFDRQIFIRTSNDSMMSLAFLTSR